MVFLTLFQRFPFVRLTLALVIGLWIGWEFAPNLPIIVALGLLFLLVFTLTTIWNLGSSLQWINGGSWLLLVGVIGVWLMPPIKTLPPEVVGKTVEITGFVTKQQSKGKGYVELTVLVEKSNLFQMLLIDKKLQLLISGVDSMYVNSRIAFKTKLIPIYPTNSQFRFDYNRYLLNRGVVATAFADTLLTLPSKFNITQLIPLMANFANSHLKRSYQNIGFKEDELGVMLALLDGDKSEISKSVKEDYQKSGTTHILAVSGMHVGIIAELLLGLFAWLDGFKMRRTKVAIVVLLLWLYTIIAGLEPSIIRATIMFSILIITRQLQREASLINALFLSAFIILLLMPNSIFDAGFWLSYLAVGSIILFYPKIEGLWSPKQYLFIKIWELVAITLSAQIATAPYIFYLFGTFPTYFLFSNMLIIPAVPVAMIGGVAVASLSVVTDNLVWLNQLIIGVISYMNGVVRQIQLLPLSQIVDLRITFISLLAIYLVMIFIVAYKKSHRFWLLLMAQLFLIFAISASILGECENKMQSNLTVISQSKPSLFLRNGDKCILFSSNINEFQMAQIQTFANQFSRQAEIDTFTINSEITPFFLNNEVGLIIKSGKLLQDESWFRYSPRWIVVFGRCKLSNELIAKMEQHACQLIAYNSYLEDGVDQSRYWNLYIRGDYTTVSMAR